MFPVRNICVDLCVRYPTCLELVMASTGSIFFAGVGSTFAILAIGFGGGFLMANSTLHDGSAQKRASSEPPPAVRVVLPASAEPASQVTAAGPVETPAPATTPEQQATPQGIPNEIRRRRRTNRLSAPISGKQRSLNGGASDMRRGRRGAKQPAPNKKNNENSSSKRHDGQSNPA